MKRSLLIISIFILSTICFGQTKKSNEPRFAHKDFEEISQERINEAMDKIKSHPRLLMTATQMENVRLKMEQNPICKEYVKNLKEFHEREMSFPVLKREMEGRRLLSISRKALQRIFAWSFLYNLEGDKKYADRAEKEMLAIADFSNWNPSHFLDVAEMTMAMAIGYDSFFNVLPADSLKKIRTAILEKGITPSYGRGMGWIRNDANWNQVCHAGMLYGVLAIAENEPELARKTVWRSVNGVTWSMASYEPDGNYTEGPGYWGYGTGFNIMLLAALETALSTDFGRSDAPGFLKSIHYYENVFGSTGYSYNYPDSGYAKMFEASAFWYAKKQNDPSLLWNEHVLLQEAMATQKGEKIPDVRSFHNLVSDRLAPMAVLYCPLSPQKDITKKILAPQSLGFVGIGNGLCPVFLARTAWDKNAAYLGIKAGTPRSAHGHMDAGSFIYENHGVRWAVELGPENYNKIEQMGMNLWSNNQDADRWKLFRYNNYGHNTLTVNGKFQLVSGLSKFTKTHIGAVGENSESEIDLSSIYAGELDAVTRQAILTPKGSLLIKDHIIALKNKDAVVEWRMMTPAKALKIEKNSVILGYQATDLPYNRKKGVQEPDKKLSLTVQAESKLPIDIKFLPAKSDKKYDAENRGISILIFTINIPKGQAADLNVTLK